MAYDNEIEFPNGIDAPTAAFPNGKPKNATSEAGTDGYPFEELKQSDFEAILQGLMLQSGISPNNTGDTALQGQYLDAMFQKFGRIIDLPADLDNNKFVRLGECVRTKGQSNIDDGVSRHYILKDTLSVPTPASDDIVLSGDSAGLTAVFVGEVFSKRVIALPFVQPPSGTFSGQINAQLSGNIVHISGSIIYSGTDISSGGAGAILQLAELPAGYGGVGHYGGVRGMSVYKATEFPGMIQAQLVSNFFSIRPTSTTEDGAQFYFECSYIRDVS